MSEMESDINKEPKKKSKVGSYIAKWGSVIFFLALIGVIVALAVTGVNFGDALAKLVIRFEDRFGPWGIYLGVALISVFANFTIIFPVPYTIALIVVGAVFQGEISPVLVGLSAGFGASIGEVTAWAIGRGSQEFLAKNEKTQRMKKYIDRGWAPLLIFIFAATPLPDDAFLIVLGFAGYSIVKTLIWCFLGKFVLCFLTTAIPVWLSGTPVGDFMYRIFGITPEILDPHGVIPPATPQDLLISSITWVVTLIIIFVLVYVDWDKVFHRVKDKHESHPPRALKKGVKFHPHDEDAKEEPIPKDAQSTENEKK